MLFDLKAFGDGTLKTLVKSGAKTRDDVVSDLQKGFDVMWAEDVAIHIPGFDTAIVQHFHNGIAKRVDAALAS